MTLILLSQYFSGYNRAFTSARGTTFRWKCLDWVKVDKLGKAVEYVYIYI